MTVHQKRVFTVSAAALLVLAVGMFNLTGSLKAQAVGPESVHTGEIYQLQAAFHRAKTTQDINLMMSLWDPNGTLNVQGDPNSPYVGFDHIKAFWQNSGSFTHHRFSLVPSFKTQINVHGDEASLYFECHDVGDFDQPTRFIAGDTFLSGTVRNINAQWVFSNMTAGKASPLSVDHYYLP
jgi:SnoaL-like domain